MKVQKGESVHRRGCGHAGSVREALGETAQLSFASACFPRLPVAPSGSHANETYMSFAYDYPALASSIDFFFDHYSGRRNPSSELLESA